ncbi:glycosyltransferase family 2 protein [Beijerinckia sp. L45]|uniref:glycosyltransferase family 2 protein n=1 Tax=Beijerinckia sp. L45 TaxID=1641855 RepID=UPI00131B8BB3|nr:glycosyltransferase family 2 protein [Beijerinckia sp. L45]
MTKTEAESVAEPPVVANAGPLPLLPLVSVIIVNFNYGRFLDQAIASVFAQTYPRVECIVVDNCSTDDSDAVIVRNKATYPRLKILRRASNDGQTAASCDGLRHTDGPYVVFLDADDYLLPQCVERHMHVHLSARIHVGLTCGDMLQVVDDQVVTSTYASMSTYIQTEPKGCRNLIRPTSAALGPIWDSLDPALAERIHFVPRTQRDWVWSPTSGNCFRRDALNLFCDRDDLAALRSQTDLYLAVGINTVSGSILIDEPLFAYRIHGTNVFSSRPQLSGLLTFDPSQTSRSSQVARHLLLDQFVAQAQRFVQEPWQAVDLLKALRRLDVPDHETDGPRWARRSCVARALVRHFAKAVKTFGGTQTRQAMQDVGVPWHIILVLLWKNWRNKGRYADSRAIAPSTAP